MPLTLVDCHEILVDSYGLDNDKVEAALRSLSSIWLLDAEHYPWPSPVFHALVAEDWLIPSPANDDILYVISGDLRDAIKSEFSSNHPVAHLLINQRKPQ